MKKLNKDDSGQSTTEYILILAVVVGLFFVFLTAFRELVPTLIARLTQSFSNFFNSVDFHQFPFRR